MKKSGNNNILNEQESTLLVKGGGDTILGAPVNPACVGTTQDFQCVCTGTTDVADSSCVCDLCKDADLCSGDGLQPICSCESVNVYSDAQCIKIDGCSCDAEICSCDAEICSCDSDSCSNESCTRDFTPICGGEISDFHCDEDCPFDSDVCSSDCPTDCPSDCSSDCPTDCPSDCSADYPYCTVDTIPSTRPINADTIESASIGGHAITGIYVAGTCVWSPSLPDKLYFPFRLLKEGSYLSYSTFDGLAWQEIRLSDEMGMFDEFFNAENVGHLSDGNNRTVFWVSAETSSFGSDTGYLSLLCEDDYEYCNSVMQTGATAATLAAFNAVGINNIEGQYIGTVSLFANVDPGEFTFEGGMQNNCHLYWDVYVQYGGNTITLSSGDKFVGNNLYNIEWGDEQGDLTEIPAYLWGVQHVQLMFSLEFTGTSEYGDNVDRVYTHSDASIQDIYIDFPVPTAAGDEVGILLPSVVDHL